MNALTEKERQAIYDVIAYEERKHDIFDPKHVERMSRTIQEKLAKLREDEATSNDLVVDIEYILDNYDLNENLNGYSELRKECANEIANLPKIRANSSNICKVNDELLEALEKIANAPYPANEFEYSVFHDVAITIANNAIQNAKNQNQ